MKKSTNKAIATKNVSAFKTIAARSRAITQLKKKGFNYFVIYQGKHGEPTLQYTHSDSAWVKSKCTDGAFVSGTKI